MNIKKLVAVVVLLLTGVVAGYWIRGTSRQAGAASDTATVSAQKKSERKILYYQDPMHPAYRSDKPGTAPDCGMDLVPVYEGGEQPAAEMPEGAFRITPEKQQLIGVRYSEVTRHTLSKTIRAVGRLAYDETRITRVHSRTDGWIEQVFVDFTGKLVQLEQPLLSYYSPELVATQDEYLIALRARDKLGASSFKDVSEGAYILLDAARRRLERWDVTEQQIQELERTRKPIRAITLFARNSGVVLTRNAFVRQRITPDTELYQIADLSTIWLIADIYEYEAAMVRLGQQVVMSLSYLPGRNWQGKITFIYPQVDPTTRTLKVRAEFQNPGLILKPEMYAEAGLRIGYGPRLTIPDEAVLDSGTEKLVFVSLADGYFEPRKVELGAKVENEFIVLRGLKQGERIVTSANFLVDSESKLKSAVSGMGMPGMDHGGGAGAQPKKEPSSSSPSQPPSMDHSQHKLGEQAPQPKKPMDQSQREKKPEQHNHD